MKIADKLQIFDHIDEKYVIEATPKRFGAFGAVKTERVESDHHPFGFLESAVSVAAIFLVIGAIFVWTLVGKDLLGGSQGNNTTDATTTTEPQTTPFTTTDNGIVPPIPSTDTTTPMWHTTTVPTTTTTPTTTTNTPPVTTTAPVTTPPTPPDTRPTLEQVMNFDADGVIDLMNKAGCPEDKLPAKATEKLTDAEAKKIIDFLNDPEARRFISSYSDENYFAPAQIDLFDVLRFNRERMEHNLSKDELNKEIEALKAKYPDYLEFMGTDPVRVTGSQFEYLVKKYLGIDTISDDMKKNLQFYLESSDAYYAFTGGVFGLADIIQANAWNLSDGNILVLVRDLDDSISTVVLKPNGDSYLFVQSVYLPEYDIWR